MAGAITQVPNPKLFSSSPLQQQQHPDRDEDLIALDRYTGIMPPEDAPVVRGPAAHTPHLPLGAVVATAHPPVAQRKPRARRAFRALFCCVASPGRSQQSPYKPPPSDHMPIANLQPGEAPPSVDALDQNGTYVPRPTEMLLLPPVRPTDVNKNVLIVDLDETLVHSSFKPVKNADFIIPVEIDGVVHQVYVLKRPFADEFLQRIGQLFECVLFTASLAKYADPVTDLLDKWGVFRARLFREACTFHKGNYVKDLTRLGRDVKKVIIVDNSPASYAFHPDNAIPVQSWFDDMSDTELLDLVPFLEKLARVDNVFTLLRNSNEPTPPPMIMDYPAPIR